MRPSEHTEFVHHADFAGAPAVTAAGDRTVAVHRAKSDGRGRRRRRGRTGFRAR
ncbi:hypothetical protein AB9128_01890 [Streptomyces cinereoruber]|uniref:hypothetical protein n=1 Tax=Streptomyces cinereoruber TaxID=67260 RepID=UPI003EB79488